jgi:hypothetical protein
MATEQELERIVIRLTGDGSLYQKMLLQAQEQTKLVANQIKKDSSSIEGFYNSILGFAKTVVGSLAGFGVVQSLEAAFDKFSQMETTMMRLESSVRVNTEAVEEVTKDYVDFASQISKTTLTSKTTVLGMLQLAASMGVVGDKAKEAVQMSIALAGAKRGEASQYLSVSLALQQGHMHLLRHLLHMREEKDESKILAAAQKMLASGYEIAGKEAGTASGSIGMLKKSLGALTQGIGELVAEQIKPFVEWTRKVIDAFNKLDAGTKAIVIKILAVALALPLIIPALTSLKTVFMAFIGPAISLFGMLVPVILTLLDPIVLVGVAIAGLAGYFVYLTYGGEIVQWFGKQWDDLVNHVRPAIQGIKDAINAGDLKLAFEIVWAQIKLSFFTAIYPLSEGWVNFTSGMKKVWAEASYVIQTIWVGMSTEIMKLAHSAFTRIHWLWLDTKGLIAGQTREEIDELKRESEELGNRAVATMERNNIARLNAIRDEKDESLKAIDEESARRLSDISVHIDALKKQRDKLVKDAADAAAKISTPKVPKLEIPKIPDQEAKVHLKFDAAAFGSAEALSRIEEFKQRMGIGVSAVIPLPKPERPEPSPLHHQAVDLNDIKLEIPDDLREALDRQSNILEDIKNKPTIVGAPIGLV